MNSLNPQSAVAVNWVPLSVAAMRRVLQEVAGPADLPDEVVTRIATGFLVPEPGSVHFVSQRRRFDSVMLMLLTLSAMRVKGGGGLASHGLVHVAFLLSGSVKLTPLQGPLVQLQPGAAVAINDWRSFDAESSNGTRCLNVFLPERTLTERGVHLTSARFRLEGSRSLRSPLRDFALAIVDSAWNGSTVGQLVAERTIEDLLVGMFLEADGYAMDSEDLRAGLRSRAIGEIATQHRQKELSPALVADHLSVSLRHLQRAFENSGQTIAHAIAERRAESAALLLTAPASAALTIEEVAGGAGFGSVFELRTAFRNRYGMLPSEFRHHPPTARD